VNLASCAPRRAYKRYALGLLTVVPALTLLDINLLGLLAQPIKQEMHLSDSELGFLNGAAFSLFYALLTLPIGRWVDRGGNRVSIASACIGLWGVMVMACLLVTNFAQLVLTRVGAGLGESGCWPATYSLVGDYFPAPAERTRALTIYNLANPIPVLVSLVLGGWLNERYGWRIALFVMGLPGLLVAALVRLTVRDPRKSGDARTDSPAQYPRAAQVLSALWSQKSSRNLIIATVLYFTINWGMAPWIAAFMIRNHGLGTAELGIWMGLIGGIGGIVGVLSGGYVVDRWFTADERGQVRLCAVLIGLLLPGYALLLFVPGKREALLAYVPLMLLSNVSFGPAFALMQRLVVDELRATTLAVVMVLVNLIATGVGPQVVGVLSDLLQPHLGNESLRYAMLLFSLVALWGAHHFWQVGRTVERDLVAVAGHTMVSE
jgi:MFS family permease